MTSLTERCQSGRMGHPAKVLAVKTARGFESLPLRQFMKKITKIILIAYILFISVFALDVFEENKPLGQALIGFLIHLIPSFIIITLGIIASKNEKMGGILFIILGALFSFFFKSNSLLSFLLIPFPLFLIGLLFLLGSKNRGKKIRKN